MEWYIILVIVAFLGLVVILDLKILFYYEHPDDSKYSQGLVAKVIALVGFQLAWLILVGVPTDAFNSRNNGGLDMEFFWQLIIPFVLLFLIFPIPYATAFYEADTDPRLTKTPGWLKALKTSGIIFVCCAIVVAVMYFALRSTEVMECTPVAGGEPVCVLKGVNTPFLLFGATLIGFCGWILVTLYLGVGIVAVPVGLIVGFIQRPKPITQQDYNDAKAALAEQIAGLKAVGEDIRQREVEAKGLPGGIAKWREQRGIHSQLNKFRQSVYILEEEFSALNVSLKQRGENPFFSYVKLVAGCLAAALSIVWFVHIIIYILVPQLIGDHVIIRFIDDLFEGISKANFYVADLLVYQILVGYLLLCTMIGCFRFNMKMFCCCSIHPMKKHDTHLNSILFNTALILVASLAISHLSYIALRGYCRDTYSSKLFGQYIHNTVVFRVFYRNNIFIWLLLIWMVTCLVYLVIKPKEKKAFTLDKIKNMKLFGGGGNKQRPSGEAPSPEGEGFSVDKEVDRMAGKFERTANVMKLAF